MKTSRKNTTTCRWCKKNNTASSQRNQLSSTSFMTCTDLKLTKTSPVSSPCFHRQSHKELDLLTLIVTREEKQVQVLQHEQIHRSHKELLTVEISLVSVKETLFIRDLQRPQLYLARIMTFNSPLLKRKWANNYPLMHTILPLTGNLQRLLVTHRDSISVRTLWKPKQRMAFTNASRKTSLMRPNNKGKHWLEASSIRKS